MTPKENIVIRARASISWIYSNLLGRKANIKLLPEEQRQLVEDEYVWWVSYLLPIEQSLTELEELKRDVKELIDKLHEYQQQYFMPSIYELTKKLSKVGKEE